MPKSAAGPAGSGQGGRAGCRRRQLRRHRGQTAGRPAVTGQGPGSPWSATSTGDTLINRLVDVDLLPTGNVPLTKVAVVVRAAKDGPGQPPGELAWTAGPSDAGSSSLMPGGLVLDGAKEAIEVGEGQAGPSNARRCRYRRPGWLAWKSS